MEILIYTLHQAKLKEGYEDILIMIISNNYFFSLRTFNFFLVILNKFRVWIFIQ